MAKKANKVSKQLLIQQTWWKESIIQMPAVGDSSALNEFPENVVISRAADLRDICRLHALTA